MVSMCLRTECVGLLGMAILKNFNPSNNSNAKRVFRPQSQNIFQYIGGDIVYYLTPNVNLLFGDVDHYLSMLHNLPECYTSMPETIIITNTT